MKLVKITDKKDSEKIIRDELLAHIPGMYPYHVDKILDNLKVKSSDIYFILDNPQEVLQEKHHKYTYKKPINIVRDFERIE